MIRLTVSEVVVQAFAGMVTVLVVAGVAAVLTLGSRARRSRSPLSQPARAEVRATTVPARLGAAERNGTSHPANGPGRPGR